MPLSPEARVLIPPVWRLPFAFDGSQFYVVLDGSRENHGRASPQLLHSLLTHTPSFGPVLTKAGKPAARQPPPYEDRSEAFYLSQLIHYGLKPLKIKAAAKKALLKAYETQGGTLVVPAKVDKVETELAAEFWKANEAVRKTKQRERDDAEAMKTTQTVDKGKRKRDEDDNKPPPKATAPKKVAPEKTVKKPKTTEAPAKMAAITPVKEGVPEKTKPAVKKSILAKKDAAPKQDTPMKKDAPVKKEVAAKAVVPKKEVPPKKDAQTKKDVPAKKEAPVPKAAVAKSDLVVKKEVPVKKEVAVKKEVKEVTIEAAAPVKAKTPASKPSQPASSSSSAPVPARDFTGTYIISAPALSTNWDAAAESPLTLTLSCSSTKSHLWGCFSFGVFEGYIRSSSVTPILGKPKPTSNTLSFQWRGRETGTGESSFDKDNKGTITFLGNGTIKGTMYWDCLGDFEFTGGRAPDRPANTAVPPSVVVKWRKAYRALNEDVHERENRARWGGGGGWGGTDDEGGPEESDSDYVAGKVGGSEDGFDDEGYAYGFGDAL